MLGVGKNQYIGCFLLGIIYLHWDGDLFPSSTRLPLGGIKESSDGKPLICHVYNNDVHTSGQWFLCEDRKRTNFVPCHTVVGLYTASLICRNPLSPFLIASRVSVRRWSIDRMAATDGRREDSSHFISSSLLTRLPSR